MTIHQGRCGRNPESHPLRAGASLRCGAGSFSPRAPESPRHTRPRPRSRSSRSQGEGPEGSAGSLCRARAVPALHAGVHVRGRAKARARIFKSPKARAGPADPSGPSPPGAWLNGPALDFRRGPDPGPHLRRVAIRWSVAASSSLFVSRAPPVTRRLESGSSKKPRATRPRACPCRRRARSASTPCFLLT